MPAPCVTTGVPGLDHVLGGGLPPDRIYLVQGNPGAGKTTLALQFLLDAIRRKERVLYITLGETKEELADVAESHGWSLDGLDIFELNDLESATDPDAQYTLFHPAEVELGETVRRLTAAVEGTQPQRVVFDSLSEMRLLARDPLRYRRQILSLKQFFGGKSCTVLLLDDGTSEATDLRLQSIAHGVLTLEQMSPEYGAERRRLRVVKLRGVKYRGGYHDFTIEKEGVVVYPRLVASDHTAALPGDRLASGVTELDALCGGGLDRGSSTLLLGPAGSGKSSLAAQFIAAAAARGERSAIFAFDEGLPTLLARSRGMGIELDEHVSAGLISLKQVDPAELAPGQFAALVQDEVKRGARIVLIDSMNGYLNAMPEERFLLIQMHELLRFTSQAGVATVMTLAQHGLVGDTIAPIDLSYLADTALLLRYFESEGAVHKAVSVIKRRRGAHETSIREISMSSKGLVVGKPLRGFRGVLTGVPVRDAAPLTSTPDGGAHVRE